MDWLTFFSKVIEALAWPFTLIALVFLTRKHFPQIINSLRKLKYKHIELEFSESTKAIADEVKAVVPELQPHTNKAEQEKNELTTRLTAIAELAPRAAILEAWLQVEAAAADVIRKNNLATPSRYPGPLRLLESLRKGKILNERQLAIFDQLRSLRNDAVHVPEAEFTQAAVNNYIESSIKMASYLEARTN